MIDIDLNGNINDIIDIREADEPEPGSKKQKKEPKKHGVTYDVPDELLSVSNSICPMYLWGKAEYIFPSKDKKQNKKFKATAAYHEKMLIKASDKAAMAITLYFKNAAHVDFKDFDIHDKDTDIKRSYFAFRVNGEETLTNPKLLEPWENREIKGPVGYSHISGRRQILRQEPQPKIKGVKGGQPSGAAIISRDRDTYPFNVHGGSINPNDNKTPLKGTINIGWIDSFEYATALNWLLNSANRHCHTFGNLTIIYWSEGFDEDRELFEEAIGDRNTKNNPEDKKLFKLFDSIRNRPKIETDNITEELPYHICGFMPNSGRTLWAFDINSNLEILLENIAEHFDNMKINGKKNGVPLWKIPLLTIKEGQKINNESSLFKQLLMTIFKKQPFPQQLIADLLHRITEKAASCKNETTNSSFLDCKNGAQLAIAIKDYLADEASIIKAILIRNYKKGDDIHMALNKENPSTAYQFGRLFAAAQLDIRSKNKDDRKNMQKVKEKWLRGAVETPGKVYAEFLMSANLHNASNKRIGEILSHIDAEKIPKRFSQEEKLQWFIGYYQETEAYWQEMQELKKKQEEDESHN